MANMKNYAPKIASIYRGRAGLAEPEDRPREINDGYGDEPDYEEE